MADARLTVFDSVGRVVDDGALHSEPDFHYLNRSGRPEMQRTRDVIEDSFSRYPARHQNEMRARLRGENSQHRPAVFELALHELALRADLEPEVHPTVAGASNQPDFLMRTPSGEPLYYMEAAYCFGQSESELKTEARMNQLYDGLDNKVVSPDCFLEISIHGDPSSNPPIARMRGFLAGRLASYEPEPSGEFDLDELPTWSFTHEDWNVDFRPIPKSPEHRGDPSPRPLGVFVGDVESLDPIGDVHRTVEPKAGRYGKPGIPYVVAMGYEPLVLDDDHVWQALVGRVSYQVDVAAASAIPVRAQDGIFLGPGGKQFGRVSGVLVARFRHASGLGASRGTYFPNPWADHPLTSPMTGVRHFAVDGDALRLVEGGPLPALLGLPDGWPLD